ncbi:serine/threonine protein phosphatase [Rhodovarius crocodyli]|uniref:Serine/threonine protein phosphatase n=1 Tax=Rhodovarius crocodyli TaxID=1979269 RepID=A0A437MN11_9PROT|nr:metallophosphoesterase family protein [Rhodovarius crocodyli]RVT99012.1 serine/threonine protein phosphatase [Rhodovarius crocodyli]
MLPRGERIYAIGDIHGCLDKLKALHAAIRADIKAYPVAQAVVVHLGDYIDRGPDSAGVVRTLMNFELPSIFLMGNHEATALAAMDGDGAACTDWLYNGGDTALRSWGLDPDGPRGAWRPPAEHVAWMRGLRLSYRHGGYLFVHAGIRPGVPLEAQDSEDLIRIRRPFLDSQADHGVIVVHGHTPTRDRLPERHSNRVNLDTGAVYGGPLTCGVFEGEKLEFLSA